MTKYLLDTNAFFELISYIAGKNVRCDNYDYEKVRKGECYISRITELEIISVIGKYGRGEQAQWQNCGRLLSEDGTKMCTHRYFHKGQKRWNKKVCRDMLKLVKEILTGASQIMNITVLEINEEIIRKAEEFMMRSFIHKFGSQDALVAATAIINSSEEGALELVTSDKGLLAAIKDEGISFFVPGKNKKEPDARSFQSMRRN